MKVLEGSYFKKGPRPLVLRYFNLHPIETITGIQQRNCRWAQFARLNFGSNRVQTQTIAVTCDYTNHYISIC